MDTETAFSLINRIEWDNDIQAYRVKNNDSMITSKRYVNDISKHKFEYYDMMI